jgi:hypothetical protein
MWLETLNGARAQILPQRRSAGQVEHLVGQGAVDVLALADPEERLAVRPIVGLAGVAPSVVGVARAQQQDLPGPGQGPHEESFLLVGLGQEEASADGIEAGALGRGQQRGTVGAARESALHEPEDEHCLEPAGPRPVQGQNLYRIVRA